MKYIQSYNESLFSVRKSGIDIVCKKYSIKDYIINDDLSIDVNGDVHLANRSLEKIPLNFNIVKGNFIINNNKLLTLEGSPKSVGELFNCEYNKLKTLKGYTNIHTADTGYLYCGYNPLLNIFDWEGNSEIYYEDTPINELVEKLMEKIPPGDNKLNQFEKELSDRLEEFNVIKDNRLDLISLNSLYDFYNLPFDENEFKNIKGYVN